MFKADYHVHTSFSGDCSESPDSMFESAVDMGIREIAVTDHLDIDLPSGKPGFDIDVQAYKRAIEEYRAAWDGRLRIVTGLEIGLQPHLGDRLQRIISDPGLDFVIGSVHSADGRELADESFFQGKSRDEAHRRYFLDLYENLRRYDGISVIGHMDYVNRYGKRTYGRLYEELNYSLHIDIIEEILRLAVKKDIGLEINTSGWRYGLGHANPHNMILSRYRELGGTIITLGSDAHRPEDVGQYLDKAKDTLENLGFTYICGFRKGEPSFYPLSECKAVPQI